MFTCLVRSLWGLVFDPVEKGEQLMNNGNDNDDNVNDTDYYNDNDYWVDDEEEDMDDSLNERMLAIGVPLQEMPDEDEDEESFAVRLLAGLEVGNYRSPIDAMKQRLEHEEAIASLLDGPSEEDLEDDREFALFSRGFWMLRPENRRWPFCPVQLGLFANGAGNPEFSSRQQQGYRRVFSELREHYGDSFYVRRGYHNYVYRVHIVTPYDDVHDMSDCAGSWEVLNRILSDSQYTLLRGNMIAQTMMVRRSVVHARVRVFLVECVDGAYEEDGSVCTILSLVITYRMGYFWYGSAFFFPQERAPMFRAMELPGQEDDLRLRLRCNGFTCEVQLVEQVHDWPDLRVSVTNNSSEERTDGNLLHIRLRTNWMPYRDWLDPMGGVEQF